MTKNPIHLPYNPVPGSTPPNISSSTTVGPLWPKHLDTFSNWYGVDDIYDDYVDYVRREGPYDPKISDSLLSGIKWLCIGSTSKHGNGWAILALLHGPQKVVDELIKTLSTMQLVSGLVLTVTLPMMVNLPSSLVGLPVDDPKVQAFGFLIMATTLQLLMVVCFATCITAALNSCARTCDTYKMVAKIHNFPQTVYNFFVGSFATMILAFFVASIPVYSYHNQKSYVSIGISELWLVMGLLIVVWLYWTTTKTMFMDGHVVYSWYKKKDCEYNLHIALRALERNSIISKQYRADVEDHRSDPLNNQPFWDWARAKYPSCDELRDI